MPYRQALFFWGIMICPLLVASKYSADKDIAILFISRKTETPALSAISLPASAYLCRSGTHFPTLKHFIDNVTDLHSRHHKHYGDIFLLDTVIGMNQFELLDALYLCVWSVFRFKVGHIGLSWLDCRLLQTLTTSWQYWHAHKRHLTLHSFFDALWMR